MNQQVQSVEKNLIESTSNNMNNAVSFVFAVNSHQNGREFYFNGYYFYFSNLLPFNAEMQQIGDKT